MMDLGELMIVVVGGLVVNAGMGILGYGALRNKVENLEKRAEHFEDRLNKIPETYVTYAQFQHTMNRLDGDLKELRDDIKKVLGFVRKQVSLSD